MDQRLRSRALGYALGVLMAALAVLLGYGLFDLYLRSPSPLLLLVATVLLTAWLSGLGPALVATAVGVLGRALVVPPHTGGDWMHLALAALVGVLVGALSELVLRARRRAEAMESTRGSILDAAVDGIIAIDRHATILTFNPAAERIFGYRADEVLGRNIKMLMPEPYQSEHDQYVQHYLATGQRKIIGIGREVMGKRKDGSVFPMDLAVSEAWVGGQRLFTGIVRDITERKRAQEALAEAKEAAERSAREALAASRAKDRFLAVLSHELRTPLAPALAAASALSNEDQLPPSQRQLAQIINRNVELEARLIDDLLDLTRISAGKLELHWHDADVHELLNHVVEICHSDVRLKRIELQRQAQAAQTLVRTDAARLQQVFWNLLKNAVKFTPSGGCITLRTWNEPASGPLPLLCIEVRDNGMGIDPAVLPRLFEPFEQGNDEALARKLGGLGLGLAISKALIQALGGRLEGRSAGKGQGASFVVQVPGARPVEHSPASPQAAPQAAPSPLAILLVEDHPDTRAVMRRLLEHMGHKVAVAESVAQAMELVEAAGGQGSQATLGFDLLISDLGLPDGTGLDLMERLRPRQPFPAIALSGYGMEEDVLRSRRAGFTEHLIKPVTLQQLSATIRRVVASGEAISSGV